MAVMTSAVFDKAPMDLKDTSFSPVNDATFEPEANGIHDVLFDESEPKPSDLAQPIESEPTLNGDRPLVDTSAPATKPTTNASSGIEGVAQFLPDSQTDANSLFDGPELGATSVTNAAEAPTSDARDEPGPDLSTATQVSSESTQQVPETQLPAAQGDNMDISQDEPAPIAPSSEIALDTAPTKPMNDLSLETQQIATSSSRLPLTQSPTHVDHEMEDAPTSGRVRSREEDDDEEEDTRDAKRTKTEEMSGEALFKVPEIPTHADHPAVNGNDAASATSDHGGVQSAVSYDDWPSTMTISQNKFLLERLRNTKKIKVSQFFKDPVDAIQYPSYPQFVSHPMDLSVMESKLKENRYNLVREFMEDLDLVIDNCVAFNGKDHAVTQAGYNMRAYFLKGMGKMPKSGIAEPVRPAKPKKPTVSTATKARRDSRPPPPPTAKSPTIPTPTVASPQTPWPLGADGMPMIRRDSSSANDRPKREIHRPPSKDLPYNTAKPKKKKYQQELKFCESVMSEIMKPKYTHLAFPFMNPVDPVALNIPTYLKIIKKPMDFGTIDRNLKAGQYQNAKDFYNDATLVFQNCFKFNPDGDDVNRMGKQFQEIFEKLWREKSDWLAQHAPTSDPQSPDPAYSDEEEEEEEEVDPAQAQFLAIQQQIAALNETAQALLQQQQGKRASPKIASKKKSVKPALPKKKTSLAVPPPMKSGRTKQRVKAPAPLTFAQKQEISDGISTLGDADMRKAVQIIRNGCPNLASVNDDEMEIDMDEISDDTLRELFKFIKQVRGPKGSTVDDDYEAPRVSQKHTTAKPKKNKPMGKKEQEEKIRQIHERLQAFNEQPSASGSSASPAANQDDESSGDDESGSESEEE